jgi:N-acetylmuramoyl-L-alanine amidase
MFMRLKRTAAILAFGSHFAWPQSPPVQITAIRFWSFAEVTRIVIDTSAPCEFKTGQAQAPERLYLDIAHARPLVNGQRSSTQPINDSRVRQVRVAEMTPEVTRIVFDLTGPVDFRITTLDAPDRLVVELQLKAGNVAAGRAPSAALTDVNQKESGLPPGHPVPLGSAPLLSLSIDPSGDSVNPRPVFSYPPKPAPRQIDVPGPPSLALPLQSASDPLPGFPDREKPLFENVLPPAKLSLSSRTGASEAVGRPSENASRSLTRALGLKINRVVIDAGHGGHDDGAVGLHGVREKNVVLDIALRLAALVRAGLGAEVVLTRSDDRLIPLQERTAIANDQKADLFLSIHANSSPYPSAAGTETYFLNLTSSPGALELAARENAGSTKTVGELQDLLQSISLNDKIEESATLARDIENAVETLEERANSHAQDRGVKRAPFVVLIGASMPSVLAEIGFLSNSRDEANLNKPEYRQKIAEALYKGIANYRQSLSHF